MPRKILMLCYYFPPIDAVGTRRSEGFVKYLPEFGWEPVVLTVRESREPWVKKGAAIPHNVRIERAEEYNITGIFELLHGATSRVAKLFGKDLKRNYFSEYAAIPDPQITWNAVPLGRELARECEAVYVSCSPFSSCRKALKIAEMENKPLVVDFRDAWSFNPHIQRLPYVQKKVIKWEKEIVKKCASLILNTPGSEALYRERFPEYADKFISITNGYDALTPIERDNSREIFTIMHLGNFYRSRSPKLLLDALADLNNDQIEFVHVGEFSQEVARYSDRVRVRQVGIVPASECQNLMRLASLLFVVQGWEKGIKNYVAVAHKTFEYLATGLPILTYAPEGDNTEMIRSYANRAYIVSEQSIEKMKGAIITAFSERHLRFPPISQNFIFDFDRKKLTGDLAKVFEAICSK